MSLLIYACRHDALTPGFSQDAAEIGPGIGPAATPAPLTSLPPPPASLPPLPTQGAGASNSAYTAATVSSGPQPPSLYPQPAPVMLPPLHYQGMDAPQPFGYQPPPPGAPMMHPARMAAMAGSPPMGTPPQAGMVRSADEMEGAADDIPPAKRQRVAKLPGAATARASA